MNENILRIILPVLLLAFMAHRGYYIRKHSRPDDLTLKQRDEGSASRLAGLLGILGFSSVLGFVINPGWLTWASLPFPEWVRWAGVFIALFGFTLLQWAQNILGASWSDNPRMIKGQVLITAGPYRAIRHPIYSAFLLILGSILFISANWFIGFSLLFMAWFEIYSRVHFEENLLIEYFGDQYSEYMQCTGRLIPKII